MEKISKYCLIESNYGNGDFQEIKHLEEEMEESIYKEIKRISSLFGIQDTTPESLENAMRIDADKATYLEQLLNIKNALLAGEQPQLGTGAWVDASYYTDVKTEQARLEQKKRELEIQKEKNAESLTEQGILDGTADIAEETIYRIAKQNALLAKQKAISENLSNSLISAVESFVSSGFTESFEWIGESIYQISKGTETWADAAQDLASTWANIGKQMMDSLSTAFLQAGLQLIAASGGDWGKIGIGLGLIAASGVSSILSGILSKAAETSDSSDDDQTSKLNDLKDLLREIIDQAKTDADYYEKNLLHKKQPFINKILKYPQLFLSSH